MFFPGDFRRRSAAVAAVFLCSAVSAFAAEVVGTVRDETGGALAGVTVQLQPGAAPARTVESAADGGYRFEGVPGGRTRVTFSLVNFATSSRELTVPARGIARADVVLSLSLSADVTVTGPGTFVNLADAEDPAGNLVGHRAVCKPGRDHAAPARRAADHARRRSPRNHPRRRDQPAQW